MLTHFDVLFQLFNQTVFLLDLDFHISVLAFQLLHQKTFKVVCFLTHRSVTTCREIVCLLLKLSSQVFDVLFFFAKIDMHRLDSGSEPSVFIVCDIILNFQISVEVLNLFTLLLLEDRILVSLADSVLWLGIILL